METYRVFFEEGEFFCWTEAEQLDDSKWAASVLMERSADHKAGKTAVPAMRHKIRGTVFPDKSKAVGAAFDLARSLIEKGDVGL